MNFDLKFYWRLALRRLPAMLALLLLCTGIGIALAVKLPTVYETSARLLVESPQIDGELAPSTVTIDAREQLQIIQQRLMTRANLIDIANRLNVFENISTLSPDDVVSEMRGNTRMRITSGPMLLTVQFSAKDGPTAAAVVNEYVTLIQQANVRLRTGQAGDTLDFFEQEVERLTTELSLQSQRILEFKTENAEALPDNVEFQRSRRANLQEQLTRLERERTILLDQRTRIVELFETTGRVEPESDANLSPRERELRGLQNELANSLVIFSETNPKVKILQSRIARLEEVIRAEAAREAGQDTGDTQATLYEITIAEIETNIAALDARIEDTTDSLSEIEAVIARAPENGIVLDSLQRDYDNIQQQYNSAVGRLSRASMGERIELSSKGQRISIVEQANIPREPASPNRPLIAIGGFGAGLAMAAGLFLLLELLNRTIRRPADLITSLGITPLATINYIETKGHRRWRIASRGALTLAVLIGVPAGLWALDQYYLPLDLVFERFVSRMGFG